MKYTEMPILHYNLKKQHKTAQQWQCLKALVSPVFWWILQLSSFKNANNFGLAHTRARMVVRVKSSHQQYYVSLLSSPVATAPQYWWLLPHSIIKLRCP